MIYAEMDEASPDPETYRTALFAQNADVRRELLQTLGMAKVREMHTEWLEFLKAHPEKSEDALLAAFASASILDEPLESHSRQTVLHLGFGDDTEHPFGIIALFIQGNAGWRHIATFACACGLGESIDPVEDPRHRAPFRDLVLGTTTGEPGKERGYLLHETHFRMKDGALRPLIDFEKMREQCPSGSLEGPACTVWETRLEREMLVDKHGTRRPGFALVTMSGHPPSCDMCGLFLRGDPACVTYVWDEALFSYALSEMVPVRCGQPLSAPVLKHANAVPGFSTRKQH